jgi:hypothetical protein
MSLLSGLCAKTKQASSPVPPKKLLNKTDERLEVNLRITPSCLPPPKTACIGVPGVTGKSEDCVQEASKTFPAASNIISLRASSP